MCFQEDFSGKLSGSPNLPYDLMKVIDHAEEYTNSDFAHNPAWIYTVFTDLCLLLDQPRIPRLTLTHDIITVRNW